MHIAHSSSIQHTTYHSSSSIPHTHGRDNTEGKCVCYTAWGARRHGGGCRFETHEHWRHANGGATPIRTDYFTSDAHVHVRAYAPAGHCCLIHAACCKMPRFKTSESYT